ncbi:MAG: 50S ribosomal protein L2, partial [bacterium]|jgi:large subunit ribosomal protein L2|nr:50S ribosomal protein L2 [Phycisphaerales bacterium]MCE2652322.1 50S ribosomal protein L2 [Planctomycetaceae bacterium]
MPIRIYDKTSAGRRFSSVNLNAEVTKFSPEKSLLRPLPKTGGRNNSGKITSRGRGGGAKRQYRLIDFRRADRDGIVGEVVGIEYDPNRTAHIALVKYTDGVKRYIIAPVGLQVGQKIQSSATEAVEPKTGNNMPLKLIPTGLAVHCVELQPGKGGQICRSAGMYARLMNKEGRYATIMLPSGEMRMVSVDCRATIGEVGNPDQQNVRWGKAGRMRHLGRRPITRGVAKSHNAHPLGGGSGRSKGNRPPCGPTGVLAKGGRTRNPRKHSSKLIIRRRVSKRYGQVK